jgi:hypothetical protein
MHHPTPEGGYHDVVSKPTAALIGITVELETNTFANFED